MRGKGKGARVGEAATADKQASLVSQVERRLTCGFEYGLASTSAWRSLRQGKEGTAATTVKPCASTAQ